VYLQKPTGFGIEDEVHRIHEQPDEYVVNVHFEYHRPLAGERGFVMTVKMKADDLLEEHCGKMEFNALAGTESRPVVDYEFVEGRSRNQGPLVVPYAFFRGIAPGETECDRISRPVESGRR